MTFEDEQEQLFRTLYVADLTELERSVLRCGVHQWLGPAHCSDEMARVIGFADWADFAAHIRRLLLAIDEREPLSGEDWRRVLISAEMNFSSDIYGCGVEWSTVTGWSDEETVRALRSLQLKLVAVARGQGAGDGDAVRSVD
jgi:hypothetical protein